MPLALLVWLVTLIDNRGFLTGAPFAEDLRFFKAPGIGTATAYFMLSWMGVPALRALATEWAVRGSGDGAFARW